jgi:Domain of unknown function (DUF4111)
VPDRRSHAPDPQGRSLVDVVILCALEPAVGDGWGADVVAAWLSDSVSPVIEFVRRLDVTLGEVVAGLVATYLHGSAAFGGFVTGRSDVDVLVVCHDQPLHPDELTAAAGALRAAAAPCPGRGLELSMVARRHALHPGPPWPFLLHVTTDPDDDTTVLGAQHPGDPDLLMHYVACRAAGIVVRGPPPAQLVGEVARVDVLGYLEVELRWALDDAPEAYGVLNACRALAYLDEGKILSKADGARYALDHGGPHELITAALAMQLGDQPQRPPSEPARRFLSKVGRLLHAEQQ